MTKKLIHHTKRWLLLFGMSAAGLSMGAQSTTYGNTFVHAGSEAAVHSVLQTFTSGGVAPLDGIVGTERTSPQGFVGFVGTASWSGASDARHIDGYARSYMTSSFIFPIGDNGKYRPCRVSAASVSQPASAAYFRTNPSTAITSSLKGGNEPALPSGTYSTSSTASDVRFVSMVEYWDINGAGTAQITLTWDASSGVAAMTGSNLSKLTIVGWDGTQWVAISSAVDASSILGGVSTLVSGSITSAAAITPNTYEVYTLAAFCPVLTPTALAISRSAVCSGSSITLSATTVSDTLKWFRDPGLTQFVGMGSGLTVTPSASIRYYAAHISGVCISSSVSDSVTVATNCPSFPIADTSVRNPALGTPLSVGPTIVAPTGGSVSAAIIGGFSRRAADAQSIDPLTGLVTLTPNDTAFVGQDTLVRQICFTIGGVTTCDTSYIVINNKAPNTTVTDSTGLNQAKVLVALTPVIFEGGTPTATTSSPKVTVAGGIPTYTPSLGFVGIDTQYVYRCDASSPANCDTTRLIVSVLPQIADSTKGTTTNKPVTLGPKVTPSPNVTDNITASNGSIVKNPDGSFIYTPNPNFVGTDTVRRIVCTSFPVYCDTSYTMINVAPSYADSTKTTTQGIPVTAGMPVAVMPGSSLSVTKTGPSNGTALVNPDGTITYTPNPSFIGADTVARIVCVTFADATQKCDTSLLIFGVTPNLPDTKDTATLNGGSVVIGTPIAGTSISVAATAQFGLVSVNPDGTIVYTPSPNFVGVDSVRRIVCDTLPNPDICDTSYIVMVVAPVLQDSSKTMRMNSPVEVGNPLVLGPSATQQLLGPASGTVSILSDGTLRYTPNNNVVGSDTLRRVVCVQGICDTAVYVFKILPDVKDTAVVAQQGTPVTISGPGLTAVGGSVLSYAKAFGPSNGIATVDPITGLVFYTPQTGFIGIDTVVVNSCITSDGGIILCEPHLVIIKVAMVNKTAPDIATGSKNEQIAGILGTNDHVLVGTTYGSPIASVSNPSSILPKVNADGTYTFTATVAGTYTFTISVCPPSQTVGCPTETLTITVIDPDRTDNKPIVNTDYPITKPNSPVKVNVLANDASGNSGFPLNKSSLTISTAAKNGTAIVNADGSISYTPKLGFIGKDTFYYTICDSVSPPNCSSAMVVVLVTNEDNMDVQDDLVGGKGVLVGNTLSNDKFPVGSKPYVKPQDVIIPGKGRFVIDSFGNYRWTPEPGFYGNVQIVITTCDGKSPETCFTSTLHIAATNKAVLLAIPNYISPNGDGLNDVWNLDDLLTRYPKAKVLIYNRWGNIVWRSTGPYGYSNSGKNVWYGQSEGSSDSVSDGVYYYLLELEDEFQTSKTGFVQIMRQ